MGFFRKGITSLKLTIAAAVIALGIGIFGAQPANAGIVMVPRVDGNEIVHVHKYVQEYKKTVWAIVYEEDGSLVTEKRPNSEELRSYVYFSEEDAKKGASYVIENLNKEGHPDIKIKIIKIAVEE